MFENIPNFSEILGGGKQDRTADLLHAMQALSQLSYTPKPEPDNPVFLQRRQYLSLKL